MISTLKTWMASLALAMMALCIGSRLTHASQKPPTRIVSLAPVATEFLFALGLGDRLVGVTTFCDRPKEAMDIGKIGGFADPQLEAIVKLNPDLVVATPFGNAKNVVRALSARGIATLAQPVDSLDDMRSFLTDLGVRTSRVGRAKALQSELDSSLAKLSGSVGGCREKGQHQSCGPKVLLLISASPLIAAGPSTFAGEVLKLVGVRNVVTTTTPAWPVLSLETLMHSPPEFIVVTDGAQGIKAAESVLAPLLSRHKGTIRLVAPDKSILQRPGPHLIDDVKVLIGALQKPHA